MPELPEVETVVRDLRPRLVGRAFRRVTAGEKALRRAWSADWPKRLRNRRIKSIERRGKWILVELDGPWLLVHLGMTGQFTIAPADTPRENHTHVVFTLDDGSELRFRDIRRFGSVSYFPSRDELDTCMESSRLGPEPFDLEPRYWRERLTKSRRCIKAILLDQSVVAGVGNIYADESLFEARLHPALPGTELTPRQATAVRRAIPKVLNRAIERRGSTIRNYVGGSGLEGEFQNEFRVYGRTGEPCVRCKTPIKQIRLAGRSTHFCPRCQKRA